MNAEAREKHAALMRLRSMERRMQELIQSRYRREVYRRKLQELCDQAQADYLLIGKKEKKQCPVPISADPDQLSLKF